MAGIRAKDSRMAALRMVAEIHNIKIERLERREERCGRLTDSVEKDLKASLGELTKLHQKVMLSPDADATMGE